jgi:hypothetical protein
MKMTPNESVTFNGTLKAEVVDMEEVTVPAGTFECYKINHTLIERHGMEAGPIELRNTIWVSAEENFSGIVKIHDYASYDHPATTELVSFSP